MKNTIKLMLLVTALFTSNIYSQCVKKIVASDKSQIILKVDNTLWAKGNNWYGQLGLPNNLGTNNNVTSYLQIGTSSNWKDVVIGLHHTLALKTDGTLWAWGRNVKGALGNGTYNDNHIPTQIGTDTDWKEIAVGSFFSIALKQNGEIWGWGENEGYQLGIGTFYNQTLPIQAGGYTNDWKSISAGTNSNHVIALKNDNTMWGWGQNIYGELGLGDFNNRNNPTLLSSATDWKEAVAGWGFTLALKTNGTLWSTGYQQGFVTGAGNINTSGLALVNSSTDWKTIGTKSLTYSAFSIKNNGTLWGWAQNVNYQLGIGTTADTYMPVQIGTATNWKSLFSTVNKTLLLDNGDNLFISGIDAGTTYTTFSALDICPTLNIEETDNQQVNYDIKVYPNPVIDNLTIKFNIDENISKINLFNTQGQLVKSLDTNNLQINVSDLSSGYYFLEVITENNRYVQKFIKQTY